MSAHTVLTLIFAGKTDALIPLDHATRFHAALPKSGVATELIIHNGSHGFDDAESLQTFIKKTTAFLKAHLRRQQSDTRTMFRFCSGYASSGAHQVEPSSSD
jgi:dienelactone hydrolase